MTIKHRHRHHRGAVIYMVVVSLAFMAFLAAAVQWNSVTTRATMREQIQYSSADTVARGGLNESLSWFRRQSVQPVHSLPPYIDAAFYPRQNSDPTKSDTLDESIGLVKEFPLTDSGGIWGRFEVRRQQDPAGNPLDPLAVHDITTQKIDDTTVGQGIVWSVTSRGYVYYRRNPNVAYNLPPNQVIGTRIITSEIRRLNFYLPTQAAAIVKSQDNVTFNCNGKIEGMSAVGLAYFSGTSGPNFAGCGDDLSGNSSQQDISSSGQLSPQMIFKMSASQLKNISDVAVKDTTQLPVPYPSMSAVFIDGNAVFSSSCSLRGGGILFVNGNLTIAAGGNAFFTGLIYVKGNASIASPALIDGTVIVEGSLQMSGFSPTMVYAPGEVAEIDYDAGVLNSLQQQLAYYREAKSNQYVSPNHTGANP